MPRGKRVPVQNTPLYKAVVEDLFFNDFQKEQILSAKTQKELFKNVSNTCNEILNNGCEIDFQYNSDSLLNNTGCGEITRERMCIQKRHKDKKYHCYYVLPELIYQDPDEISYHLYLKMAMILNSRKEKCPDKYSKIKKITLGVINNNAFCLKIINNSDLEIELSGDWVIDWNLVSMCKSEIKYEVAMKSHTIAGHVFWPCRKKGGRTINVIRTGFSIMQTLNTLNKCYNFKFEENEFWVENTYKELTNAFVENKDWFNTFFDSIDQYIDFFSLGVFLKHEIKVTNINEIMQLRLNELMQL